MEITSRHYALARRLADRGERWDSMAPVEEGYLAAVERIEDHSADPHNPYWIAPHDEAQVIPGVGLLVGPDGEPLPPEEARAYAYELLVLADLAEGESGT